MRNAAAHVYRTLGREWRGCHTWPHRIAFLIGTAIGLAIFIPFAFVWTAAWPVRKLLAPVGRWWKRTGIPWLLERQRRVPYPGRWRRPWILVWLVVFPLLVWIGVGPLIDAVTSDIGPLSVFRFAGALYCTVVLLPRLFRRKPGVRLRTSRRLRATRRDPWRGYFKTD